MIYYDDDGQDDFFEQSGVVSSAEEIDDIVPRVVEEERQELTSPDIVDCLFTEEELVPWRAEWQNMPEFNNLDHAPKFSVIINFACAADCEAFGKLIGQPIKALNGRQLQSLWHPEQEIGRMVNKRYIEES